ncbi:hypothetical protein ABIE51_002462 [Lysobacter sp. OAE881]|uniref:hypothetical protein n=1 Tax=Lysobacter sp. OAE881 TaxID=2663813 RepID=UPI00178AF8D0
MTAGDHLVLEQFVDEAARNIIRKLVDPWLYMEDQGVRVKRIDGSEIAYSGIKFEGSPREVFWSSDFINPYLRAMVDDFISRASKTARQEGRDVGIVLHDVGGMLTSGVRRVLERMADIDQRLRGKGFPQSVQPRSIEQLLLGFNGYIAARIKVEHGAELMHARTIMIQASAKASSLVDTYSTWLMAGLAAFVAVLISNQEKVAKLVTPEMLTSSLVILFIVVAIGIVQKAVAVMVAASAAGENVGRDVAERGEAVAGFSIVIREILAGTLPPIRWFMRRRLLRVLRGDIAADGKSTYQFAQAQTVLAIVQMLLVAFLIGKLAWGSWLLQAPKPASAEAAPSKGGTQSSEMKSATSATTKAQVPAVETSRVQPK